MMNSQFRGVLPAEIQSQIIYQYILGIWFKEVLQLRLASKFFDLEVIRALLDTVDYRPPVHIKWQPLTYHLFHATVEASDGTGKGFCHGVKETLNWFRDNMPGALDVDKYMKNICEWWTLHVEPNLIIKRLRQDNPVFSGTDHLRGPLWAAIACNNLHIVQQLLAMGADIEINLFWSFAMNIAIKAGSTDVTSFLLEHPDAFSLSHDPDEDRIEDFLIRAARFGHVEILRLFVTSSKNYIGKCPKRVYKYMARAAAASGHLDVLRYLTEVCPPDSERSIDEPSLASIPERALDVAASHGHRHIVEAMLSDDGFFQFDDKARARWNALDGACFNGHIHIVRLILEREGPMILDTYFLDRAAGQGHLDICKLLIAHGAVPMVATLKAAAIRGQLSVLRWLHESKLVCSPSAAVRSIIAGKAIQAGFIPVAQYIFTELGVIPDPPEPHPGRFDSILLYDSSGAEYRPLIFTDIHILTAMANGQEHMVEELFGLGYVRPLPPYRCAKRVAAGMNPLCRPRYTCVRVIEDPIEGTNMQMWAKKSECECREGQ